MDICRELLDALDEFDRTTAPLGLYACEEYLSRERPFLRFHQEWHLCLKPCLERLECEAGWVNIRDGRFSFKMPNGPYAKLTIVRTSKIKVRKYGSHYRVDSHHKYAERWQELRLDRTLSDLWKPSALAEGGETLRMVLFIGFAQETDPFHKELARLNTQLEWDRQGATYQTRVWEDRYERRFYNRLCGWFRGGND